MMELSKKNFLKSAEKYDVWSMKQSFTKDDENRIMAGLSKKNYLTKADYKKIVDWKSPRVKHFCDENTEDFIKEVSSIAFKSNNEQVKIEVLTLLRGTSFPVASAILHFRFPDKYPILDFRALWSLRGTEKPPQKYNFDFWWKYVEEVRSLSNSKNLDIRTIDKALWFYSKENQPKA